MSQNGQPKFINVSGGSSVSVVLNEDKEAAIVLSLGKDEIGVVRDSLVEAFKHALTAVLVREEIR